MDAAAAAGPISATAEAAAFGRAIESLRRGPDRLVYDPFARLFLSRHRRWLLDMMRVPAVAAVLLSLHERRLPGVLGNLLCRTRFIDDTLIDAIERGTRQVVILGSGFDSRPYRIGDLQRLPIFEVDRAALLSMKRSLLESALGRFPSNVSLVALDLHKHRLAGALTTEGFNSQWPTFFIWEGVTQYLPREAIDEVVAFVGSVAAGSQITFTYINQAMIAGAETNADAALKNWVERLGEPWISGFAPEHIGAYLATRCLVIDAHVGAADFQRRYLEPAGRKLNVYGNERVVSARVVGQCRQG